MHRTRNGRPPHWHWMFCPLVICSPQSGSCKRTRRLHPITTVASLQPAAADDWTCKIHVRNLSLAQTSPREATRANNWELPSFPRLPHVTASCLVYRQDYAVFGGLLPCGIAH
jgi:hypothetical protein